ncbi:MAG TPA: ROK family transcriptional regulator [Clostridiales bacterium]|nr:ROK family transcriptional regulator [Clostridiales bacterium]
MKGNNLPRVKQQNRALIMKAIYNYAPISRSKIAEMLSLTPPTITTNIAALMEDGLVYEIPAEDAEDGRGLGRKPVSLDFIEDARFVVGVEINAYQTTICLMNLRGKYKVTMAYIPDNKDYGDNIRVLSDKIGQMIQDSGIAHEKILGVGVGLPGFVERHEGILRRATSYGWNNKNVANDLSSVLKLPVTIENNARAKAIGEELLSGKIRPDTFAYYMISYGVACPLYIKNSMITGESAGAGEIGHTVIEIDGPKCKTCGNFGCLEEVASERAILSRCKEGAKAGRDTMLTSLCPDIDKLSAREVLEAQICGDEFANEVVRRAIVYLGAVLANVINLISPPLVIVDGYIMKLEHNRQQLLAETRKHLFGLNDKEVEIEFLEFDQMTGAKGAGALAIKKYFIK